MAGRILVLDDEENYAEMLQELLIQNNFRVDMATNPGRAISQLEEIPYDLVISDYKMPVLDGAEFLRKAREIYAHLPVILVSGLMNTPELVKVANMGVTLVLEKPLDTDLFLEQVARFCDPLNADEKAEMDAGRESAGINIDTQVNEIERPSQLPERPRYFAAGTDSSHRFLEQLWARLESANDAVICQPEGGDAENAVRDLSNWLGFEDRPILVLDAADLVSRGGAALQEGGDDASRLVAVNYQGVELDRARQTVAGSRWSEGYRFVWIVSGEQAGDGGQDTCELQGLHLRASDLARYAARLARAHAGRLGKAHCANFTPPAIDQLLAYHWPGNYDELKEVIGRTVEKSENSPIAAGDLAAAIGVDPLAPRPGAERLREYLLGRQLAIVGERTARGADPAEIAAAFGLSESEAEGGLDLPGLPLIRDELTRL